MLKRFSLSLSLSLSLSCLYLWSSQISIWLIMWELPNLSQFARSPYYPRCSRPPCLCFELERHCNWRFWHYAISLASSNGRSRSPN
jgi:hypothetical protein